MTELSISLSDGLGEFVDEQVKNGGYRTAGEYIQELIRQDQRRAAEANLEALLLEGLDSGPAIEGNPEYWENARAALIERHMREGERLQQMEDRMAIREGLAQADVGDARPVAEVFGELKEKHSP